MSRKRATDIPAGHLFVKYKKAEGQTSVYLSYFIDGQNIPISTKVKVLASNWDDVRQEVSTQDKDHKRKNRILTDMMADVDRRLKEYYDEGNAITPQAVRRILKGEEVQKKRAIASTWFVDYAHETNELRHKNGDIGYSVFYNNKLNINKFGKYLETQYGSAELRVSQINADILINYIAWRKDVLHNTSREGINKSLTPLIQAVARAWDNDILPNKVYAAVKDTYLEKKDRQYTGEEDDDKDIRYLTEEQMKAFVELYPTVRATTQRYMDVFLFAFHSCGLRISDVETLEWRHVDFDKRMIKKNLVKFNKPHEIPLNDSAIAILRKYQKSGTARFVFGLLPDDFNLLDKDRFFKRRNSVNRTIQTSLTALGHKIAFDGNLTMHVARHTFAVLALRAGVTIHMISELMGHSSSLVTESTYAKFLPQDKEEVVRTMLNFPFLP